MQDPQESFWDNNTVYMHLLKKRTMISCHGQLIKDEIEGIKERLSLLEF
jgi:hypothetical protein